MIFYFSGTGNTRWAAEQLAQKTQERLLFIPEELKGDCHYTLQEGERIGFCFPTHGWQPPHIVRTFIRRLSIDRTDGHYCYALTTCGDSIGKAMDILARDLARKYIILDSAFSLVMPESYVCLPFMYTDSLRKERYKITNAERHLKTYAELIERRERQHFYLEKGPVPWLMSHVVGGYFNRFMVSDKKFEVDATACLHCGMCQKVCPTGDLVFTDGLPTWRHDGSCTSCLACYHHCPEHAINYGYITRSRGQYYFGHDKNDGWK